jgi:glycine/D-amino acid oxidase-like deaminating enzyme
MSKLPDVTATEPFWWEGGWTPQSPDNASLPTGVDVLVIGAGLTGLSAARTLARRGQSVLVLDAKAPGSGASSRNGGMIGGGHRLSISDLESRYPADQAIRLLREAHIDSMEFALSLIRDEHIDCDYAQTGRFRAFWDPSEFDSSARELARLQERVPIEAIMVPKARQREEVASDLYEGGMIFPKHGALHPAKWVAGLQRAAVKCGALIQGNTPVVALGRDGAAYLVRTPRGKVRAGKVLAATNGYTPAILGNLRRRIIPVPSFIVATELLGKSWVRNLFPSGRMIVESRDRNCYFRPSPDGTRVIFGGRAAMFDAPEALARQQMRRLLAQVFPQLDEAGLSHSWRGRTGFTFNTLPNVGHSDGLWHAMGYCGNGNTMAPYLGHKVALQMVGDPDGKTAFSDTGLSARWWHQGSPWFLPFADLAFRMKDRRNNRRKRT